MGTCKGDGGSPLVCPSKYDPNTYVQAGIVAWGIGCGEQGTPGVYADVSKATCWIDQAITCHYAASTGKIFNNIINEYSKCSVQWEQGAAPLVDISDFERANEGGYANEE